MLMGRILHYLAPASGDEQADVTDRRIAHRKAVLLRATIYPVDAFYDARIHDVSATGLKGEVNVELAIGQTLHVTADGHTYHTGTVKWTRGALFGLSLANAIEVFLGQSDDTDHGGCEGHHPRAQRSKINATARIVAGRPPRPATVRNLSTSGMLLDTSPKLKPGQYLVVKVGKLSPIYGRVQWSVDGKIGFKAERPICNLAIMRAVH